MRLTQPLLKHVPLIKFVGGPHKHSHSAVGAHPLSNGLKPSSTPFFNSNPIEPKAGEYFSRSQLPARFRYRGPKEDEMESIVTGGAEVVF